MELKTALKSIRRGWAFVLIGVIAAAGTAVAIHRATPDRFVSEGSYLVVPVAEDPDIIENIKALDGSRSRLILTTLTEILESEAVAGDAVTAGAFDADIAGSFKVNAAVLPEANGVTLSVSGTDRASIPAMASLVAAGATERFESAYRVYTVTVLDAPTSPAEPAGRTMVELGLLAGALGLVLGVTIALLRGPGEPRARREKKTVSNRIDAYGTNVTPLHDRDRYQRVG